MKRYIFCCFGLLLSTYAYAQLEGRLVALKDALAALAQALRPEELKEGEKKTTETKEESESEKTESAPEEGGPPPPPPPLFEVEKPSTCTPFKQTFNLQEYPVDQLTQEEQAASDECVKELVMQLGTARSQDITLLLGFYKELLNPLVKEDAFNHGFRFLAEHGGKIKPLDRLKKLIKTITDFYTDAFAKNEQESFEQYLERMDKAREQQRDAIIHLFKPLVYNYNSFHAFAEKFITQSIINTVASHRLNQEQQSLGKLDNRAIESDKLFVAACNGSVKIEDLLFALQKLRVNKNYLKFGSFEADLKARTDLAFGLSGKEGVLSELKGQQLSAETSIFSVIDRLNTINLTKLKEKQFLAKYLFDSDEFPAITTWEALQNDAKQRIGTTSTAKTSSALSFQDLITKKIDDFDAWISLVMSLHQAKLQAQEKTLPVNLPVVDVLGNPKNSYVTVLLPSDKNARDNLNNYVNTYGPELEKRKYDSSWTKIFACAAQDLDIFDQDARTKIGNLYAAWMHKIEQDNRLLAYIQESQSSAELYQKIAADSEYKDAWALLTAALTGPFRTPVMCATLVRHNIKNKQLLAPMSSALKKLTGIIEPYGMLFKVCVFYADCISFKITQADRAWNTFFSDVIETLGYSNTDINYLFKAKIDEKNDELLARFSHLKKEWSDSGEDYKNKLRLLIDGFRERNRKKIDEALYEFVTKVGIKELENNIAETIQRISTAYTKAIVHELLWECTILNNAQEAIIPGLGTESNDPKRTRNKQIYALFKGEFVGAIKLLKNVVQKTFPIENDIAQLTDAFNKISTNIDQKLKTITDDTSDVMPALTTYFENKIAILTNCTAP